MSLMGEVQKPAQKKPAHFDTEEILREALRNQDGPER